MTSVTVPQDLIKQRDDLSANLAKRDAEIASLQGDRAFMASELAKIDKAIAILEGRNPAGKNGGARGTWTKERRAKLSASLRATAARKKQKTQVA